MNSEAAQTIAGRGVPSEATDGLYNAAAAFAGPAAD